MAAEHERWIVEAFGELSQRRDGDDGCAARAAQDTCPFTRGAGRMKTEIPDLATLPGRAFPLARGEPRRDPHAQPPGEEEPADLRVLRGAPRPVPRCCTTARGVRAVVVDGAGGNFCSGGDVHEIIGPLTKMDEKGLLEFTRMTGDLVRAMRACPQPIIAAIDGVCAGAGAMIALASDFRLRDAGGEDGLPVRARRARRLRHGRLRDPAAADRAGTGRGTAVHRPRLRRGRGRADRVLQPRRAGGELAAAAATLAASSPAARRSRTR